MLDAEPRPDRATRQRRDRLRSSEKDPLLVRKHEARYRAVLFRKRRLHKHFAHTLPSSSDRDEDEPYGTDADDEEDVVISSATLPPTAACLPAPPTRLYRYLAEFRAWVVAALVTRASGDHETSRAKTKRGQ